jgi:prephenate dehydrogenase
MALADRGLGGVSFGTGAKDTTRLAASSPALWGEILLYNEPAVAEAIAATERQLAELRGLLARQDVQGLHRYLTTAQGFRQGLDR